MTAEPNATPKTGGLKQKIKLVIFALLPAVVLFGCAETLATMAVSRRARRETDPVTGRITYVMKIGKFPWSRASVTPLNSHGVPDREFPGFEDKGSCRHVVLSGDSYLFGDGVDLDSNFTEVVRRRIAARPAGQCVRLFNLGERGTTLDKQGAKLRELLPLLKPDIVILVQYQNDLTDLTNAGAILDTLPDRGQGNSDSIRVQLTLLRPNLVRWLSYHTFAWLIEHNVHRDELRHWSVLADSTHRDAAERMMATYRTLYGQLVADLRGRGIAFGVMTIPSKFDVMAGRYPEDEFFTALAREHSVPQLRMFPVFDRQRSPYTFLMYDGHLNTTGNRLVADVLYGWLYDSVPAPFAALRGESPAPVRPLP